MNIVFAALVWLFLLVFVTAAWYVTQPLAYQVIYVCLNFLHGMNLTTADQTLTFTKYLTLLWGPVLDVFVTLWFLIFGTRADTESTYYVKRR